MGRCMSHHTGVGERKGGLSEGEGVRVKVGGDKGGDGENVHMHWQGCLHVKARART
jgi:hypothetical protein